MRIFLRIKHALERFLVRGAAYQLLFVAALIGLISIVGGALLTASSHQQTPLNESVWWAFLRLTDPGYLGDDEGTVRRVISTVITVLGYVLFMGSLVAILTQWLNATIKHLESGVTPVTRNSHVLILGWTERTAIIMRDLFLSSTRVKRFLKLHGAGRLHMVVLAREAGVALRGELKSRVGRVWNSKQVTLRSGSPLRSGHLSRVDFSHAAAVILPAGDFVVEGPDAVDTHTIKALLSMSNHPAVPSTAPLPLAVAEILDPRKVELAQAAYRGPLEVVAADAVISRLVAQNIRHEGLSQTYTELLTHREGNEPFVRDEPSLVGTRFCDLFARFPRAIPIGYIRNGADGVVADINPDLDATYERDDRIVFLARDITDTRPARRSDLSIARARTGHSSPPTGPPRERRVLILGWSHKIPPLLQELSFSENEIYQVDIASLVAPEARDAAVRRYVADLKQVVTRHLELDYVMPAELCELELAQYDNIFLVGNDRLGSGEASDARTIVGYLALQHALNGVEKRPHLIVEVLDPANVALLGRKHDEVLISPVILSHMLAQIALRRDLNAVFTDLFSTGGTEITFRRAAAYDYVGQQVSFSMFQQDAAARGDLALGFLIRDKSGDLATYLNPERKRKFALTSLDRLIVLSDREHQA